MIRAAIAVMLAMGCGVGSARAQSDDQIRAVTLVTQATTMASRCGRIKLDPDTLGAHMKSHGVSTKDLDGGGPYAVGVQMVAKQTQQEIADYSTEAVCTVALQFFGPQGEAVRGLLVEK